MSALASGLSKLRLRKTAEDDDDVGEEIDANTVAGGGHAARQTAITKDQLRVSHALKVNVVHDFRIRYDFVNGHFCEFFAALGCLNGEDVYIFLGLLLKYCLKRLSTTKQRKLSNLPMG